METENTAPAPFISKTYDMVDDLSTDSVVSWSKTDNSFVVWNVPEFTRHILPKYFKHNNFSSFVRQLNTYGYRKIDPDCWEFANEGFLRGHKHLLKTITRRKPSQMQVHQETASQVQSVSVESCVEVGKFGIEEEVERLKIDKTVHAEELVRLQQQQQVTDHRLENVGQRLQLMDERQQQTMSFLAKALQSPGFIAELVHQQNESNRCISGMNKKRRFPNHEEENYAGKPVSTLHDRQIVRYQPLMNEAAIALLQKILKNNASGRLESKVKNPNGFLTNHARSFENILDTGGAYSRTSRVTLPQLPTSSQSHLISDSGISFNSETFGISDLKQLDAGDIPYIDATHMDDVTSAVPDGFSTDRDVDVFMDKMPKLPGINDVFWDQILSASPLTGDEHDIGSLALEDDLAKEEDVTGVQQSDLHKNEASYESSYLIDEASRISLPLWMKL